MQIFGRNFEIILKHGVFTKTISDKSFEYVVYFTELYDEVAYNTISI